MSHDEPDPDRSPSVLVRAARSTVGRESTTFGFSILVTATFGLLQSARGSPSAPRIFAFAMGAVLSFTVLEAVLSRGFRRPMPQHHTQVMALGTAFNLISVAVGLASALAMLRVVHGWWCWPTTPFVSGVCYLLAESLEAAVAERALARSGDPVASDVDA